MFVQSCSAKGVAEKLLQLAHLAILVPALLAMNRKLDCPNECGDLTDIPYPFGIGENCSLDPSFSIECNRTYDPPRAFWVNTSSNMNITNISVVDSNFQVMLYVSKDCYEKNGAPLRPLSFSLTIPSRFTISNTMNKFTVMGCDSYAYLTGTYYSSGCMSICSSNETLKDGSCSGVGCCQVDIPEGLEYVTLKVKSFYNHTNVSYFNPCGYAFLVEDQKFSFRTSYLSNFTATMVPAVVNWVIKNDTCQSAANKTNCICGENTSLVPIAGEGSDYNCKCWDGYEGNPYLPLGCQDIDECKNQSTNKCKYACRNTLGNYTCPCQKGYNGDARIGGEGCTPKPSFLVQIIVGIGVGLIVVIVGIGWLYLGYKKWKLIKLKEKFFEENGGFMLQQELSLRRGGEADMAKIFSQEELEKATNKFDDAAVIGKGGYGTVYKGVLEDGSVVAIKKSKIVDQSQTQQFVNEVLVLSQIRHRNVVKLLGCCLETEVPLLVYEFVNNGTLFEHVHCYERYKLGPLSWELRLKIAAETADVLSYLHSSASTSIIHRDIKSTNILLDDGFTAKVADFGASKLVPLDQTQLSTMVQGTLGYLDPEYLLTSELTEKSDVYSFGIVLLELLTGKKAVSFEGPENERNLAMFFLSNMKEDHLLRVLDKFLVREGDIVQMREVSMLAKTCLALKGDERPSMREIARVLGGMSKVTRVEQHPWELRNEDEQGKEQTARLLGQTFSIDHSLKVDQSISLHGR